MTLHTGLYPRFARRPVEVEVEEKRGEKRGIRRETFPPQNPIPNTLLPTPSSLHPPPYTLQPTRRKSEREEEEREREGSCLGC